MRALTILTTLTAALGLTACNGDDGTSDTQGESATAATVTATTTATTTMSGSQSASATETSTATGTASASGTTATASESDTDATTTGTASATATTTTTDPTTTGVSDSDPTTSTTGPMPSCGDGVVDPGEACDDGDQIDNNACSNACTKVPCDQQESMMGESLSYIWIANSPEGTVSKINTKTAIEEARYRVAGGQPSRTSVNLLGDVAVSSRDPGAVTKIAANLESCVDANNNGMIETSSGPGDIKPLGQDECVLWTKMLPSTGYGFGPRATAWEGAKPDPDTCQFAPPRLWIGWMDAGYTAHFERIDGTTGQTLDEVMYPWGNSYSPYGGAVDADGNFYATGLNTSPTVKIDAQTLQLTDLGNPNGCKYGMTLDNNGDIWAGACFGEGVYHWDHNNNTWTTLPDAGGTRVNGIMADADGNVWGAGSSGCRLVHIDVQTKTYVNKNIPLPGCGDPWGVSIDYEGYVWVVDRTASRAFKVDPDTYEVVATVTGLVQPYTYSDMTGAALKNQVIPQ